mgnify:CR=1 FL=1
MRSNREKELEAIINEMYTHKIEVPANNTVEEDEATDTDTEDDTVEETGCNTAEDVDKFECPKCGELIQACSKAIRCNDYNNDTLKEEIGDVMCMIEFIKSNGLVTQREIDNQVQTKRMKLMKWSKLL